MLAVRALLGGGQGFTLSAATLLRVIQYGSRSHRFPPNVHAYACLEENHVWMLSCQHLILGCDHLAWPAPRCGEVDLRSKSDNQRRNSRETSKIISPLHAISTKELRNSRLSQFIGYNQRRTVSSAYTQTLGSSLHDDRENRVCMLQLRDSKRPI